MATLRAHQGFDIREVIRAGGRLTEAEDRIVIRHGDWRTSVTGDFHAVPTGTVGDLLGIAVTFGTRLVFEAALDRSGYTAFDILALRDNDRFFAYVLSGADRVVGSAGADYLIGFGGDDTIFGGGGRDRLFGGSDNDRVSGGAGGDFLSGGLGVDRLEGGAGDDTFLVEQRRDLVIEAARGGYDTILTRVTMTIAANVERLVLIGSERVAARGDADADELQGNGAGNRLTGGGGNDRLLGKGGADLLDGGPGADRLTGGGAGDTFRFSTAAEADGDTIADFRPGQDRIDLRAMDADPVATGDQAFAFLGRAAFTERPGELRAGPGWLAGDLDGDGRADFAIRLAWDVQVGAGDILM